MIVEGEFYRIETDNFEWVFTKVLSILETRIEIETIQSKELINVRKGALREIPISDKLLSIIGVKEGKLGNLYVLPTYHFFEEGFDGCCNPMYGFQVFRKEDYSNINTKLKLLLKQAKLRYSHPIDLTYDKDELIRGELFSIYNVNELFESIQLYGISIPNKEEIIRRIEA